MPFTSMKPRYALTLAAASILLLGIAMSFTAARSARLGAQNADLIEKIPSPPAPWTVKDMNIASSEEMKRAVNELLNYDKAVFREYSDGNRTLSLYVAHWQPRKFHPRLIAIHTPDVCWVGNGWKMEAADYSYAVNLTAGPAWPAQYREFSINGTTSYVLYWHVMNGKLSGYAVGPGSLQNSFFRGLVHDMREGVGEQFFIRISSNRPWRDWSGDAFLNQLLDAFSPVLLASERS